MIALIVALAVLGAVAGIFSPDRASLQRLQSGEASHFTLEVLPVLQAKCLACHGDDPNKIEGGLDLTSAEGLARGGESGAPIVVPGDPEKGLLMEAIRRTGLEMPPKENDRLSDEQVAAFAKWIRDGAKWPSVAQQVEIQEAAWNVPANDEGVIVRTSGGLADDWTYRRYRPEDLWAYQPIQKPLLSDDSLSPIDELIDRKLADLGIEPAEAASPLTLIRRITFDVIGLPPTPEEIRSFLADWQVDPDQAWTNTVDRLLDSPHYGEQAARHWLDVVRYADSGGFANDWQRPNAWRYRDYVIRSFNEDKPYDQFVKEQIAGDELNAHDPEMKVAVGFLRMGPWEHSTMSVPKVSRQQFLDDVTDAVGQVFLAHPLQCARCHDHKFDPIPTRDYYALQAVFATTQLADLDVAWLPEENREGMEADQQSHARKREWNHAINERLEQRIVDEEAKWFEERGLPYQSRAEAQDQGATLDQIPEYRVGLTPEEFGRITIGRKWQQRFDWEQTRYQPIAHSVYNGKTKLPRGITKPIELPADPLGAGSFEPTTILVGGDPFTPGATVTPGALSIFNDGQPLRITQQPKGRRLALAEWLVDPSHPVTARVIVNRIWQSHFGRGLVGTANNFGAMGKKPTHPEVLDLLAATFIEEGWSMKQMHRSILHSKAYRRSTNHPEAEQLRMLDPAGESYAVYEPRRLSAEELRDSMLAVSGELNRSQGGIPARPDINMETALQPRLIMGTLAPAYVPSAKPAQRNRRSIYALKLRGLRDPFMTVFNQPSPDITCEGRDQSNVTPQVFSLLNSQESADRSLALAQQLADSTSTDEEAIEKLFWRVLNRQPSLGETMAALEHWQEMQSLQAELEHPPAEYPREVVRRANEEMSGQVFEFVERLFGYDHYVPDLQPHEVDARTRGLADVCLMLLNSNEFMFVY